MSKQKSSEQPSVFTPDIPFFLLSFFRENIRAWSAQHLRPMPWKGERDPYKIWLSEIILQQTRVEQGLPYYQKFVAQYPTVQQLADAPEDTLMKLWEGLGYYTRARNLHATAKHIAQDLEGAFPDNYDAIRALKGVGNYTAAAIAAFAFDLPHAVVDGNVYRVLARFFGIEMPTDTPAAQRHFAAIAQILLDPAHPAAHNQAIMDFGAGCCTPQNPKCAECPLQAQCRAFALGKVAVLPVKSKSLLRKKRVFHYLIFNHRGDVFVRKRLEKDIWQGLWEFPTVDSPMDFSPVHISAPFRQLLTHQEVTGIFYEIDLPDEMPESTLQDLPLEGCLRVARTALKKNIAFPQIIGNYLKSDILTLRG